MSSQLLTRIATGRTHVPIQASAGRFWNPQSAQRIGYAVYLSPRRHQQPERPTLLHYPHTYSSDSHKRLFHWNPQVSLPEKAWVPRAYRGDHRRKESGRGVGNNGESHNKRTTHKEQHPTRMNHLHRIYRFAPISRFSQKPRIHAPRPFRPAVASRSRKADVDTNPQYVSDKIADLCLKLEIYKSTLMGYKPSHSALNLEKGGDLKENIALLLNSLGGIHMIGDADNDKQTRLPSNNLMLPGTNIHQFPLLPHDNQQWQRNGTLQADTLDRLQETEDKFDEICRMLQDLAVKCAGVAVTPDTSTENSSEKPAQIENVFLPLDASISILRALQVLRHQRRVLFDAAERHRKEKAPKEQLKQEDASKKSVFAAIKATAQSFLSVISPDSTESEVSSAALSHDNPSLGCTLELYESVLEHVLNALAAVSELEPEPRGEWALRVVAMLRLLDEEQREPEFFLGEIKNNLKNELLTVLSHFGTTESAHWAFRTYHSKRNPQDREGDQEMLVWHAYKQTAMNTTLAKSEREDAVKSLFHLWIDKWNNDYPDSKVVRSSQASTVLYAIASLGDNGLSSDLQRAAKTVAKRRFGKHYKSLQAMLNSDQDVREAPTFFDIRMYDALARVSACSDVKASQKLLETILLKESRKGKGKYPTIETFESHVKGLLRSYETKNSKSEVKAKLDPDKNSEFVMSLLQQMMSRSASTGRPTPKTFSLVSRLLTRVIPPNVGEHFLSWLSLYEVASLSSTNGQDINVTDYNRVLWGLWQDAQRQKRLVREEEESGSLSADESMGSPPGEEKEKLGLLCCCEHAWKLVYKLDSLSTPLLLNPQKMDGNKLYDGDLRPLKRTFELMLNICADTHVPEHFERAASVALKTLELAQRNKTELNSSVVERCLDACLDSVPEDSSLTESLIAAKGSVAIHVTTAA